VPVPELPDSDSIDTKQQIHHIRRHSDYGIVGSYSAVLFEPDFLHTEPAAYFWYM